MAELVVTFLHCDAASMSWLTSAPRKMFRLARVARLICSRPLVNDLHIERLVFCTEFIDGSFVNGRVYTIPIHGVEEYQRWMIISDFLVHSSSHSSHGHLSCLLDVGLLYYVAGNVT